jgi:hypothetical protein
LQQFTYVVHANCWTTESHRQSTSDRENSYELDAFGTERVPYAAARIAAEARLSVDASIREHYPFAIIRVPATVAGINMMTVAPVSAPVSFFRRGR